MTFEKLLFWIFSAITVYAALRVITARHPVHAVLHLVLAFVSSACLWLLLEAEFLALALVLVYVGAVMVLFLFVVMMLDVDIAALREGFARYLPVALPVAVLMLIELVLVAGLPLFGTDAMPPPAPHPAGYSNTRALGSVLYTDYVYPFEIAAVILLVAIVAAIALTLRRRAGVRYVDPAWQVRVRREDRVRLVKMPAEKPE